MADQVLKRSCFYNVVGGTMRPQEWAVVHVANFGPMVEPFWPFEAAGNGTTNNDDFSNENDFQRVDEFLHADDGKLASALNFGDFTVPIHGGRHWPRTGN